MTVLLLTKVANLENCNYPSEERQSCYHLGINISFAFAQLQVKHNSEAKFPSVKQ